MILVSRMRPQAGQLVVKEEDGHANIYSAVAVAAEQRRFANERRRLTNERRRRRNSPMILSFFIFFALPFLYCTAFISTRLPCNSLPTDSAYSDHRSSTTLWGIKGFRGWFESQFGTAMTPLPKVRIRTSSPASRKRRATNTGNNNNNNNKEASSSSSESENDDNDESLCDSFDHVLVDMNQLLHVCLRRSRSDGHGLVLVLKELDALCHQVRPKQSLVLALDGPPPAAKLAQQRQRRYRTVLRTQSNLQHLERMVQDPNPQVSSIEDYSLEDDDTDQDSTTSDDEGTTRRRRRQRRILTPQQAARKKRKYLSETRTLSITPGTDLMNRVFDCLLYWAWQRLESRVSILNKNANNGEIPSPNNKGVQVFISPSTVPGEGEVKLLEWIYHKNRQGDSIAILGGDSDLVLEALVVPITSTHNVFVILPDGMSRYLVVSLWETTLKLQNLVFASNAQGEADKPNLATQSVMKIRTDLVLLLILNGNDYLPKLRGSSGFNKLFHCYLKLQRDRNSQGYQAECLVDPDSLSFNLGFCIAFFQRLADLAPSPWLMERTTAGTTKNQQLWALQKLNSFADAGYLPKPVDFEIIHDIEDMDEEDDDEDLEEEETESSGDLGRVLVKLKLGVPGSDDFHVYEAYHDKSSPMSYVKDKLSKIALNDLLDYGSGANEDDDDESEDDEELFGSSAGRYDWEIERAAEPKVESYLYGLLWNLQTYQDGICADYAYNYGKRRSPTAREIVKFFKIAKSKNLIVGPEHLRDAPFSPPVKAGVTSLAALPCTMKHLVPKPYCYLSDELIEDLYGRCMDPEDNSFDIQRFAQLCDEHVTEFEDTEEIAYEQNVPNEGRRILSTDHSWTLISRVSRPLVRPFQPPTPFADRLSNLRRSKWIRISKVMAAQKPRPRTLKEAVPEKSGVRRKKTGFAKKDVIGFSHSGIPSFMADLPSLDDVEFKRAYPRKEGNKKARKRRLKMSVKGKDILPTENSSTFEGRKSIQCTTDGVSAVACLKQLQDAGLIGTIEWSNSVETTSSESRPGEVERVQLSVAAGAAPFTVLEKKMSFVLDRNRQQLPRKAVKQDLASKALKELIGPTKTWTDVSFSELRKFLQERSTTQ